MAFMDDVSYRKMYANGLSVLHMMKVFRESYAARSRRSVLSLSYEFVDFNRTLVESKKAPLLYSPFCGTASAC